MLIWYLDSVTDLHFADDGRGVIASDSNNTFCCNFADGCRPDPVVKTLKPGVPFTTIDLIESSGRVMVHTETPLSLTSAERKLSTSPTEFQATQLTPATSSDTIKMTSPVSSTRSSVTQMHHSTFSDKSMKTPFADPTTPSELQSSVPHASKKHIHLGLGVGIPVGVALLVSFTLYLWFRRRRGKMSRISSDQQIQGDRSGVDYRSMGFAPAELDGPERKAAPGELASELPNTRAMAVGPSAGVELCELPTPRGESELAGVAIGKPSPLPPGFSV